MKKKIIIFLVIFIVSVLVVVSLFLFNNSKKEEKEFINIKIDKCSFDILKDYGYKYDKDKKVGMFTNKMFIKSYIFVSDQKYSSLINSSSYYYDMGGEEKDTVVNEFQINEYNAFTNEKLVYYDDKDSNDNLVIILVELEDDKTLVIQYQIEENQDNYKVLENVKEGLNNLKS